ncbi:Hypothetical protein R9X50_00082000 [Acrodontium crateriforme]|uniref:AAA+ ATPase domain-containing protein n=1 Tax=Acrodontium crateriforme TaxID=150365 RepID=A0AAQ3M3X6_9PEZI|nr:Hypothetical protein R9X50_00082000 [Acrodontium crateriforme]
MMRKSPTASMQKTYDECYLVCSTAIYFEGQNNEAEALRSWRNALDQIYYHNAYKLPSGYSPRSETEKALHDSLRSMELQCKERVDLLEALRKSRLEAEDSDGATKSRESLASTLGNKTTPPAHAHDTTIWLGDNTVPQASYSDLPRPPSTPDRRPLPPKRPSNVGVKLSPDSTPRTMSLQSVAPANLAAPGGPAPRARTPSPEKKSGMLKTLRSNPKERSTQTKMQSSLRPKPPSAAAKAASQSWGIPTSSAGNGTNGELSTHAANSASASSVTRSWDPYTRSLVDRSAANSSERRSSDITHVQPPSPSDYKPVKDSRSLEHINKPKGYPPPYPDYPVSNPFTRQSYSQSDESDDTAKPSKRVPPPPPHRLQPTTSQPPKAKQQPLTLAQMGPQSSISYMKEYPNHPPLKPVKPSGSGHPSGRSSDSDRASEMAPPKTVQARATPTIPRKAIGRATGVVSATMERQKLDATQTQLMDKMKTVPPKERSEYMSGSPEQSAKKMQKRRADVKPAPARAMTPPSTDDSPDSDHPSTPSEKQEWDNRVKKLMKNLPRGVDEMAAKQIFNEIVIQGDEVHWDDVAGLEIAKSALKETVVYPFLRPDLFMGLREPARGMLLFGPPGTGKTMLARAVATESKSVFFAISASSLTSKYLGESEKLVRALFALAKALAPSIIFVDEIDSLLGARGGGSEHEATRRIKTEFLIQWSDLQKAAAGREEKDKERGDATRVLVLAATNLPWAIDEAARRRFVRRQYIPLPEDWVREKQIRTLMNAQKHNLSDRDMANLVKLTDNFSGSDITALAKDAAMGPLRSLGEKLLHMSPEDIRGIEMQDFRASLINIRPSVSKQGLKEFEDWAREFGERGG